MMSDLDSLTRITKELITMDSIEVAQPGAVAGLKEKKEARLQNIRNSFFNTSSALTGVFKTHASALEKTYQQQVSCRKYLGDLRSSASGACDEIQRACETEKLALQTQVAELNGQILSLQTTLQTLQAAQGGGGAAAAASLQLQTDLTDCAGDLAKIKDQIARVKGSYQDIYQLIEDQRRRNRWFTDRAQVDILYSRSADIKTKLDLIE